MYIMFRYYPKFTPVIYVFDSKNTFFGRVDIETDIGYHMEDVIVVGPDIKALKIHTGAFFDRHINIVHEISEKFYRFIENYYKL